MTNEGARLIAPTSHSWYTAETNCKEAFIDSCWRYRIRILMASTLTILVIVIFVVVTHLVSVTTSNNDYSYEKDPTYWRNVAQSELETALKDRNRGVAKNIILFLGDGMGPTTVTAGRIHAGQLRGLKGEEYKLSFDQFPYTGLSRTYNVDSQITDSAASGTAYLTGVKTNQGVLGLSGAVTRANCASTEGAQVDSILRWSIAAGKSTGVVTTTRITHATPAASYSHSADRDWESDRNIPYVEKKCEDIALQLITRNRDINVLMGGGRAYFYPEGYPDPDPAPGFDTNKVSRQDRRNLIQEWKNDKAMKGLSHKFVYNKEQLDSVNLVKTDYLLGLFQQDHMSYELDRDTIKEPSIAEMTQKAIEILKKNKHGYFLLVEGGKIDQGHHDSLAHYALSELVAMNEAVDVAKKLTDETDTLIVVTADHSHVMNIAGYANRGSPILGLSNQEEKQLDKKPYTTILYGTGPGYNIPRANLTGVDTANKTYVFQSAVPTSSETHGGEDVNIYASGPQSFLYTGVHEQNYIPMVMAYASCVGPYSSGGKPCARDQVSTVPGQSKSSNNGSPVDVVPHVTVIFMVCLLHLTFTEHL
uniref:Alkaline phosphatase n=1 Tax=Arion vulgaris TaxID=1028688 RepID=A0A0B6Y858_9EUPU